MPAVPPPATVFVTGVSGFSGAWIARALLENGYAVRGTVRSEEKAAYVADLFKIHGDRFESVIVPDIAKHDAFDSILNDSISAVVHVAGVANLSATDALDIMGPNTDSVLSLLESTLRHGKNVKRFVYMSSAQAMLGHEDLFHVYTEDDWAEKDLALVNEKGSAAGGQALYRASKVLAERAVINFVEEHKKEIGWDATRIVPAWIFGPVIHDWKAFDDLNLSSKIMYQHLTTPRDGDQVNIYASDYVDVRDVADAFVAALKVEAAGNERFILDAGAYTFQNLYDAVHATAPDLQGLVLGNPSPPPFSFPGAFCDSSKAKRVLQLKQFRTLGECAADTLKSIQGRL
ncbi:NAD(P)-binding protein [Dichomitus squalens]|uniref:NAD(P)-binding protein n=1 Tax=Dichomitus squalens TaxID=114155 RepID=A0A4Q9Q083_9APHY|nr:NAD(P)-binding protein [Dichomitus squalens]TBU60379.1 NAD(P)-binding protein [Dichomitus squalens]